MITYDIAFMGHLATATIVPFQGVSYTERGGQAFFGPLAASLLTPNIAAVTRVADSELDLLDPLKERGIDLYVQPRMTTRIRVVHANGNVDERNMILLHRGGYFSPDDVPSPIAPCLMHLGGLSDQEFSVDFMRDLKKRQFRLSADMQSFVWHVDEGTGEIRLKDVPDKKEILGMLDFVKLDIMEGEALTGTKAIEDQARILEGWGSRETVITCSDGALARREGKTFYARFTHRSVEGRTGRGDTFFGAYLARRLTHPVTEALQFAAALTSIKMESTGPFHGTLEEVYNRMGGTTDGA